MESAEDSLEFKVLFIDNFACHQRRALLRVYYPRACDADIKCPTFNLSSEVGLLCH